MIFFLCAYDGRCYPHPSGFVPSEADRAPAPLSTLEPMAVAIHKTYETQQTTQNTSSTITSDGTLHERATRLGRDYDLERGAENQTRVP